MTMRALPSDCAKVYEGSLGRHEAKLQLQVLMVVNSGMFGKVFKAKFKGREDTVVALKTFFKQPRNLRLQPTSLQDVRQEIEIWSKMRHPHIIGTLAHFGKGFGKRKVNIVETGVDETTFLDIHGILPCGVVCEFASHGEMFAKLPLPASEAASAIAQITAAVAYMHDEGFYHGDIKPENIVYTSDTTCKLTDFGFAGAIACKTYVDKGKGSVGYSDPEVFLAKRTKPVANDVYALAATLFAAVYGVNLYTIQDGQIQHPSSYWLMKDTPAGSLQTFIALSTRPDARPGAAVLHEVLMRNE